MNSKPKNPTTPHAYWRQLTYPLFSTTVFYLAFTAPLGYQHGIGGFNLLSLDFLLQLLFAFVLFHLSRNKLLFVLLQAALMGFVYLSSPLKIIYFSGDPVTPYDLASAWALFLILDPSTRWLIALPLLILVGLFLYNLRLTRGALLTLLITTTALPLSLQAASPALTQWLDNSYPTQPWRRGYNYAVRGPTVYLLHETVKMFSEKSMTPTTQEVAGAAATLGLKETTKRTAAHPPRRNLHLILVESLWDARQLPSVSNGPDPFDKRFRSLWEQSGHSEVLSPVYGAGTANAEFELLCGLPVLSDRIVFEHEIRNDSLPCLPQLLRSHGYHTVAFHPNRQHYWNRAYAYPRLGIDHYFALPAFTLDDLLGGRFLSDESLLRQTRERNMPNEKPLFDYSITISEHYPYHLNERRPVLHDWQSGNEDLDRYLNVIRYSTGEIIEHINTLRREDPEGLIVVLGDHSPFLGPNLDGYRDAGFIAGEDGHLDAAIQRQLSSTPLIVIDGERGPINLGRLNLYALPSKLLSLLGLPESMPLAHHVDHSLNYRPMAGLGMLVWKESGEAYRCDLPGRSGVCKNIDSWREAVHTLRLDILRGDQHLLAYSRQ